MGNATINYEQRQKCLRTESDEVAISSVSAPSRSPGPGNRKSCRACTKLCSPGFSFCYDHSDISKDFSDLKCRFPGCRNSESDHNTEAHKVFGGKSVGYKSNAPIRSRTSSRDRGGARGNQRRGSNSPQKYSKNNAQNRDVVKKSKEDTEAVSSIAVMMDGVEVGGGDEQDARIIDESDMYDLDDDSDLEYVAGNIDYADFADHFASSSVGAYTLDQFDGAMTDDDMDDPEEKRRTRKEPRKSTLRHKLCQLRRDHRYGGRGRGRFSGNQRRLVRTGKSART